MQNCFQSSQERREKRIYEMSHCEQQTGIGIVALFNTIFMARKTCEHCRLEFLIVNDVAMTEDEYAGKPHPN